MQDQIQTLLTDVAFKNGTLKEAKRLYAARLAPDFNIFDYLRDNEVGLSQCIASLLKPSGTHGQGSVFLENILQCIDQELPEEFHTNWSETVANACQVSLEYMANGRRIDIYLRFKNGEIIGIENKPWAGDQKDQLKDYAEFIKIEANGKKWLLIYLSNYEPSEESITKEWREVLENSGNLVTLSYEALIKWLQECAYQCKALVVRVYIEELVKFIRMKINGELDMAEEQEVKSIILKSDESIQSAFHISKAIKAAKEELLEKLRIDLNESLTAAKKGFVFDWEEDMSSDWKNYVGFNVKSHKEDSFYLRFNFESKNLCEFIWGIRSKDESIKIDPIIWNEINSLMTNKFFCQTQKKSGWWPWWNHINNGNKEFGREFMDWDKNEIPWIAINKNELAEKITNLAIAVHDAFKENPNLLTNGVIK